ncbi:MAG: aminotransferase class I/II-fold pyridoxal phosphate-dependent enzyme [Bilophila wadsworthia]
MATSSGTFANRLGVRFVPAAPGACRLFRKPFLGGQHSTAMPPAHAAAVLKLLERLPLLDAERARLWDNAVFFRARLSELGIPTRGTAHIVAVPTGGEARTTHLGEQLAERGVLALAARYPTVPYGDGLLRFGLTALHTHGMLRTARPLRICGVSIRGDGCFSIRFTKMNGYYSIICWHDDTGMRPRAHVSQRRPSSSWQIACGIVAGVKRAPFGLFGWVRPSSCSDDVFEVQEHGVLSRFRRG